MRAPVEIERFARQASEDIDVRALRERLGLTQADFAARFGFGLDTVRNREQRRRRPGGAARTFLRMIEREPEGGPAGAGRIAPASVTGRLLPLVMAGLDPATQPGPVPG